MVQGSFVRISSLLCGDVLVEYAFFVMQNYLTDVWGISFTHAAGILNIWGGMYLILPSFCLYLVDVCLGHFRMLALTSIAYTLGIVLVLVSSIGTCKQHKPECIGSTQRDLFYAGMSLVAVGMAGIKVSLKPFLEKQQDQPGQELRDSKCCQILGLFLVVVVTVTGAIALPYIKPWTIRFLIPTLFTALGMCLFLSGYWCYPYYVTRDVSESPVTSVIRVFVASAIKIRQSLPLDNNNYYGHGDLATPNTFGHSRCLRWLEKAAIDANPNALNRNKWKVCTATEVEEAKIAVRMILMWMSFIFCGMVSSIGNTYFVEQAKHMNRHIGKWNVPPQILLLFYKGAVKFFDHVADILLYEQDAETATQQDHAAVTATQQDHAAVTATQPAQRIPRAGNLPVIGIGLAMISSIGCCISAAMIEKKRIGVIRHHGLLEKPEDDIPMSVYWLLIPFFLLAGLDSFFKKSLVAFYANQAPGSMKAYLNHFTSGVYGLGYMANVLSVYVVGKISARRGRANWFQFTLSKSRLDKYYWVLTEMGAVNLVLYFCVAWFYRYKQHIVNNDGENGAVGDVPNVAEDPPDGSN